MATPSEWASGYLDQAKVELASAAEAVDPSVRAMLLQMAIEKIAKAALLKNGQWTVAHTQTTHSGATHMMRQLLTRRNLKKIGYTRNVLEFVIKPLVDQLEELQPAVARSQGREGPWLEYPWLAPQEVVSVPCRDLPDLEHYRGRSTRCVQLMRFARELVDKHDHLFT